MIGRITVLIIVLLASSSFNKAPGEILDIFDGVPVYYNGKIVDVHGRHMTSDGYNLGLKWQCVEYVKRYYYQIYNHKMPYSFGHAKDLFDPSVPHKGLNKTRGLIQYKNTRLTWPQVGDIIVFGGMNDNPFGHTGIISSVSDTQIEMMQQNYGKKTRDTIPLNITENFISIDDSGVLGWLRMP